MSALELLEDLKSRGVRLTVQGEQLIYKAPRGVLTDDLRKKIIRHKPALLPVLRQTAPLNDGDQADVAKMTLAEFARSGRTVRVRSRLLGEDIWWVANKTLKDAVPDPTLVVYTAAELRLMVRVTPQELINIHRIKKTFGGHIEN